MSHKVQVTIPEELEPLLDWYLREHFQNKEAATVLHFFEKGIRAAYEQGLAEASGFTVDEMGPLVEHQREVLKQRLRQIEE